ncbi:MAG: potassium/proton antiporter [Eubacteriales bacterium]|nr:potassium/proton antiporter [Eubacteriales bacterium]
MNGLILLCSVVLILCVFTYKFLSKFGVPMLLVFIGLGLMFGVDGLFKIDFDDFEMAREICSFALIFIIFFGGFGTKISAAKSVLKHSVLLATAGVVLTAFGTTAFCHYVLGFEWLPSFLTGAVLSSTDAASVFSILRAHNLNLSENTAPLLEVESGSNDPMAYVLTVTALSLMGAGTNIPLLLVTQIIYGLGFGFLASFLTRLILHHIRFGDRTFLMAFLMGAMLFFFAIGELAGGNGYLTVYIYGILVGNAEFDYKAEIVHFFDGVTGIMQMLIFFLLGILVNPTKVLQYAGPAVLVMLALTFVIRPLIVALLTGPLGSSIRQQVIVSWAGLRGAASVVFATMAVVYDPVVGFPAFDIAFIVVLLSIACQGSTLPLLSRRLGMIEEGNVLKTFNDYSEEEDVNFLSLNIGIGHEWAGKTVREIDLMPSVLLVLIVRGDEDIIPEGKTEILVNDKVVLCGSGFTDNKDHLKLYEIPVDEDSKYCGKTLRDLGDMHRTLIVMIKRGNRTLIPGGGSRILAGDTLVLLDR